MKLVTVFLTSLTISSLVTFLTALVMITIAIIIITIKITAMLTKIVNFSLIMNLHPLKIIMVILKL